MPIPEDIYEEGRNYRLRLCSLVSEAVVVAPGSKINLCDGCDEPIWVNETQVPPPLPDGVELHGDLNICRHCSRKVQEGYPEPTPAEFLPQEFMGMPLTEEMKGEVRKFFGLTPP